MMLLSISGLILLVLALLHIRRGRKFTHPEMNNRPLLSKWLVRLIWLGSVALFQILELQRYLGGQSYRPFFGLYAALIFATVVWFAVRGYADVRRQRQSLPRTQIRS